MKKSKRVASILVTAAVAVGSASFVATSAGATITCPGNSSIGSICFGDGTGNTFYYTPTQCYTAGTVIYFDAYWRDKADFARDTDPNNNWDVYNDLLIDQRIARVPAGGAQISLPANIADYIKTY